MENTVFFPALGLSIDVNRVAFTVFGIDIYWYGILIGIGMALAVLFAFKKARSFGIDVDRMIDVILIGFVLAIVFGRLYYVLFVDAQYRTFFELIDLRSGGIAIYGGVIGATVGAVIGCKWRKVPIGPMLDLTAMGFLIGQGIGRWGNFFNQEAFGNNTTSIFGMQSQATYDYLVYNSDWLSAHGQYVDPLMPVHPTFLYESVWCLLGFLILWRYSQKRKFGGEIALLYVIWYGVGRAVIEGLRTDSLWLFDAVRVSQLLAAVSAVAALAVWVFLRKKNAGKPLQIPKIPPRTAIVKIEGEDGVQAVKISWPAYEKMPNKEERLEMAKKVLADEDSEEKEEKEKKEEDEDAKNCHEGLDENEDTNTNTDVTEDKADDKSDDV